jgi:hypothetical protein
MLWSQNLQYFDLTYALPDRVVRGFTCTNNLSAWCNQPKKHSSTADCSRVKSGKVIVYTGTIAKATTCGREQ